MSNTEIEQRIDAFLADWPASGMRDSFIELCNTIRSFTDVELSFNARPGISYSLRPKHRGQLGRDMFAILDVIDDSPTERWLSVCFYDDMISDPDGRGETIPGGLAGSDGYCFDMDQVDASLVCYLQERLHEAWQSAKAMGLAN